MLMVMNMDPFAVGCKWRGIEGHRGCRSEMPSLRDSNSLVCFHPALACWAKVFDGPASLGVSETRGRAKARPYNFSARLEIEETNGKKIGQPKMAAPLCGCYSVVVRLWTCCSRAWL